MEAVGVCVNVIGTLLGLARLLIGVTDFDSIVELSKKGSIESIDLLIKDIY